MAGDAIIEPRYSMLTDVNAVRGSLSASNDDQEIDGPQRSVASGFERTQDDVRF
ncbi:MAG: hypothetical protein AAGI72_19175 [Pseudomonadota bacterium]